MLERHQHGHGGRPAPRGSERQGPRRQIARWLQERAANCGVAPRRSAAWRLPSGAVPDGAYLQKVGLAHMWFRDLEAHVVALLKHRVAAEAGALPERTSRQVSDMLSDAWRDDPALAPLTRRYASLTTSHDDLVQARPIMADSNGAQFLSHWETVPREGQRSCTSVVITAGWLDEFVAESQTLTRELPPPPAARAAL